MSARKQKKKRAIRQNSNVFAAFDQGQIAEFKEAFSTIDHDNDGFIDKDDLKDMLASLGQTPTEEYIEDMIAEAPGSINFTMFLTLFGEKMTGTDPEHEILQAFETFDSGKSGLINCDLLREAMTSMGDRFTDEEVDIMMKGAQIDQMNNFNYKQFVALLKHDLDAFYAQVECVRLGLDSTTTMLCVQQWNGILAISYPARRKYPITRATTAIEIKSKFPDVILQHVPTFKSGEKEPKYREVVNINTDKASLFTYREASAKIMAILFNHFPDFQKASVDEAFIDVTEKANQLILEAGHDLTKSEFEIDFLAVQDTYFAIPQMENQKYGIKDLQLFYGAKISMQLRKEIFETLGYTSSTGISHNKLLSKLVSSANKPNKQTVLLDKDVMEYMKSTKLTKIRGLGGKFGDSILERFPVIEKASDLWPISLEELKKSLGEVEGRLLYDQCRGECQEPVSKTALPKSMLSCKNFRKGLDNLEAIQHWVVNLSSEVYFRILGDFEDSKRWPKTLGICSRGATGKVTKSLPFPHRDSIDSVEAFSGLVFETFKPLIALPCIFLSVGLYGLAKVENLVTLDRFFERRSAVSKSNENSGKAEQRDHSIQMTEKEPVKTIESPLDQNPTIKELLEMVDENAHSLYFKCGECGNVLESRLKQEHSDHHFALNISRSLESDGPSKKTFNTPKSVSKKSGKSNSKTLGLKRIDSFFKPC